MPRIPLRPIRAGCRRAPSMWPDTGGRSVAAPPLVVSGAGVFVRCFVSHVLACVMWLLQSHRRGLGEKPQGIQGASKDRGR